MAERVSKVQKDERRQIAEECSRLIAEFQEQERLREEWMAMIAHDLRAPVTVILGYAQILEGVFATETGRERERRAIAAIRASAQRLRRMISDLLDSSRIEAQRLKLEYQVVDLPALAATVVEETAALTAGHSVRLEVVGEIPRLIADPDRLEQILINLLSNAAKYSYPETEIVLRIESQETEILVTVTNQGDGIPDDALPRLFSRFHRLHRPHAEPSEGLGLGLYITKGLVEAHGGRIWVDSTGQARQGRTTTFCFTLPVTIALAPAC